MAGFNCQGEQGMVVLPFLFIFGLAV